MTGKFTHRWMAVTLCWLMVTQSSFAGTLRVAVVDVEVPEEIRSKHTQLRTEIVNAFRKHPRVELIPRGRIDKLRESWTSKRSESAVETELTYARELLATGITAYKNLDFKKASELLLQARQEFILNLHKLRSNRELLDAHLFLGMTRIAQKKEADAAEEFRRVVYLDPQRELSTREYSPDIVGVYAKVRQEVLAETPSRVRFESIPSGATVYMNGRNVGETPSTLRLQSGEYFVLMEKPGFKPWYGPQSLKKALEIVRGDLLPESDANWARLFGVREGSAQTDAVDLQRVATSVGADLIFLGTFEKRRAWRLLGQLFEARTGDSSKVAVAALEDDFSDIGASASDLVDTLMGFVRADGYLMSFEAPAESLRVGGDQAPENLFKDPAPKKAWYEHWWIYPLIAGAGLGIYFGATELGGTGGSQVLFNNRGNL